MNRQQKGEAYRAALTAAADSLARSRINSIAAEILDDPLLGLAVLVACSINSKLRNIINETSQSLP